MYNILLILPTQPLVMWAFDVAMERTASKHLSNIMYLKFLFLTLQDFCCLENVKQNTRVSPCALELNG
jgi:hypothetical protein